MALRSLSGAALALLVAGAPALAHAAEAPAEAPLPCLEPGTDPRLPGPLPAAAALFPGVIVHGAGHYAAGHDDTALTLLWLEGAGIASVLVNGSVLGLTGASRYFVAPAALGVIGGVGLFAITLLADIYGVTAPPCGFGRPPATIPYLEVEAGYRGIYDQQFAYRHLAVLSTTVRSGRWRVAPSGAYALNDANTRLRLETGLRVLGPLPHEPTRRGSFFEIDTAATHHDFDTEGFETTTLELTTGGRLDLDAIGPTLRGAFSEASAGVAMARTRYDGGIPSDTDLLLLARFAFGLYLGPGRGEATLFYDHRHDGYAAGSIIPGLGSGVPGHFGVNGFYYVTEAWGLGAEGMVGAATIGGISARFRQR
jgi:hypothetical protein